MTLEEGCLFCIQKQHTIDTLLLGKEIEDVRCTRTVLKELPLLIAENRTLEAELAQLKTKCNDLEGKCDAWERECDDWEAKHKELENSCENKVAEACNTLWQHDWRWVSRDRTQIVLSRNGHPGEYADDACTLWNYGPTSEDVDEAPRGTDDEVISLDIILQHQDAGELLADERSFGIQTLSMDQKLDLVLQRIAASNDALREATARSHDLERNLIQLHFQVRDFILDDEQSDRNGLCDEELDARRALVRLFQTDRRLLRIKDAKAKCQNDYEWVLGRLGASDNELHSVKTRKSELERQVGALQRKVRDDALALQNLLADRELQSTQCFIYGEHEARRDIEAAEIEQSRDSLLKGISYELHCANLRSSELHHQVCALRRQADNATSELTKVSDVAQLRNLMHEEQEARGTLKATEMEQCRELLLKEKTDDVRVANFCGSALDGQIRALQQQVSHLMSELNKVSRLARVNDLMHEEQIARGRLGAAESEQCREWLLEKRTDVAHYEALRSSQLQVCALQRQVCDVASEVNKRATLARLGRFMHEEQESRRNVEAAEHEVLRDLLLEEKTDELDIADVRISELEGRRDIEAAEHEVLRDLLLEEKTDELDIADVRISELEGRRDIEAAEHEVLRDLLLEEKTDELDIADVRISELEGRRVIEAAEHEVLRDLLLEEKTDELDIADVRISELEGRRDIEAAEHEVLRDLLLEEKTDELDIADVRISELEGRRDIEAAEHEVLRDLLLEEKTDELDIADVRISELEGRRDIEAAEHEVLRDLLLEEKTDELDIADVRISELEGRRDIEAAEHEVLRDLLLEEKTDELDIADVRISELEGRRDIEAAEHEVLRDLLLEEKTDELDIADVRISELEGRRDIEAAEHEVLRDLLLEEKTDELDIADVRISELEGRRDIEAAEHEVLRDLLLEEKTDELDIADVRISELEGRRDIEAAEHEVLRDLLLEEKTDELDIADVRISELEGRRDIEAAEHEVLRDLLLEEKTDELDIADVRISELEGRRDIEAAEHEVLRDLLLEEKTDELDIADVRISELEGRRDIEAAEHEVLRDLLLEEKTDELDIADVRISELEGRRDIEAAEHEVLRDLLLEEKTDELDIADVRISELEGRRDIEAAEHEVLRDLLLEEKTDELDIADVRISELEGRRDIEAAEHEVLRDLLLEEKTDELDIADVRISELEGQVSAVQKKCREDTANLTAALVACKSTTVIYEEETARRDLEAAEVQLCRDVLLEKRDAMRHAYLRREWVRLGCFSLEEESTRRHLQEAEQYWDLVSMFQDTLAKEKRREVHRANFRCFELDGQVCALQRQLYCSTLELSEESEFARLNCFMHGEQEARCILEAAEIGQCRDIILEHMGEMTSLHTMCSEQLRNVLEQDRIALCRKEDHARARREAEAVRELQESLACCTRVLTELEKKGPLVYIDACLCCIPCCRAPRGCAMRAQGTSK